MALTKKREIVTRQLSLIAHPVAAGAVGFEGGILVVNAAGFASPGIAAANLTSVGKTNKSYDNSGGADGAFMVTARVDDACRYDNDPVDPVTRAHIMKPCYIKDDHTVSSDATDRSVAGTVVDLDDDGVWIAFI